jgi:hypothetical protein
MRSVYVAAIEHVQGDWWFTVYDDGRTLQYGPYPAPAAAEAARNVVVRQVERAAVREE